MRKYLNTLRIILSIRNTININEILHGIRCIPFVGKYIGEEIYGIRIVKIIATILSVNMEIIKAFFLKLLMFAFLFLASGAASSFNDYSQKILYLYGLLFFWLIGVFLFNIFYISAETEYSVFYLGMDAKNYIIAQFLNRIINNVVGYVVFGIPTALLSGVEWYLALLIPVAGVGINTATLGAQMFVYAAGQAAGRKMNKKGIPVSIEGNIVVKVIIMFFIFVAAFALLPLIVYKEDIYPVIAAVLCLTAAANLPGIILIRKFPFNLYKTVLYSEKKRSESVKKAEKKRIDKSREVEISRTSAVRTGAKGFRYLNEMFIKRHTKILWGRLIFTILGTALSIAIISVFLYFEIKYCDDLSESVVRYVFSKHSGLFIMILFSINSGAYISHAMYANCDSSFLMFGFYRTPAALRTMFRLRMISVIKFNLIPAILISAFSVVALALTGGEDYFLQYLFTVMTIMIYMVLFSIRHLSLYYLLQPYASDFRIKSKVYFTLSFFIGFVCTVLIFIKIPAFVFAAAGLIITAVYVLIADFLVHKFAVKTFRLR